MKKSLSLALVLILVLSLAACGQPAENRSSGPVGEEVTGVTIPEFSVTVNGVTVDHTTMETYPMYSVQATSINSAGTESTKTYVGFAISDVVKAAGLTEDYVWLEATADDGYSVTLTGDVVLAPTTLLAMTEDGEPCGSAPCLAPCALETTGDYLKGCVSILVNTTEDVPDVTDTLAEREDKKSDSEDGLPEIQDKTDKVEFGDFSFLVNGIAVTNETLKDLHIYKITVSVTNKNGEASEATYTGYKLADVLAACGVESPSAVTVKANDGYETEFTAEQIASEYTLVAIEKDKEVGEDGTVWVAPCDETESGSYCKLVTEITTK